MHNREQHFRIQVKNLIALPLVICALCLATLGHAQTIEVPVGQQAQQKQTMDRPITGMQQSQVEALFGKPVDWREAVGDPPISSWIYPDFVVYFEYDHVIHAVLRSAARPVAASSGDSEE